MEILIDYISKHQLLLAKWIGTFNLKDYEESILNFNSLYQKYKIEHVIHNISELHYSGKEEDYDTGIIEKAAKKRSLIPQSDYNVVFITQKPKDIVYSHIYAQEIQVEGNYRYCSTAEKALELLLIVDPSLKLEGRYSQIKYNIKDLV